MIPNWLYISQITGNSGTTIITVSADTNTGRTVRLTRLLPSNSQGDTARLDIAQQASGDSKPIDYTKQYLTFIVNSSGVIYWKTSSSAITHTIEYSKDFGVNWTSITSTTGGTSISVSNGDIVYFKGDNKGYGRASRFSSTISFDVEGNMMSLIDSTDFSEIRTLESAYTFTRMFLDCTGLTNAGNLVLPATALTNFCYLYMFSGCTGLTTAPELPATTLADGCYSDMFWYCNSLTAAPKLPATTLADHCYQNMFYGCTSLTAAPDLPATTLASYCYDNMFNGCTGLTTAPELLATTLAQRCYQGMFRNCTSLTTAPDLPATTLAEYCYGNMFRGCTNLIQVPSVLPATTLYTQCYRFMFQDCTSLTTAPELPATTMANWCYGDMFWGCTSLTTAPELPATTLALACYASMFYHCSNLNYIKCLATDISADSCTNGWVNGVSSTGTFVKKSGVTWPTGDDGIPNNWTVINQ